MSATLEQIVIKKNRFAIFDRVNLLFDSIS